MRNKTASTDAKMDETPSPLLHETVHNFGVFKKSGKRAIFQLDFPNRRINIIQRGVIKEHYQFQHLTIFDSEDGFLVTLKVDGKDVEFDADNMEEKYTICRLLSLVQENNFSESPESMDVRLVLYRNASSSGQNNLETIKEGMLDKRGSAKIPIWSRRRVRISPGEFSYYRANEKNALNVVQIRSETCHVTVDHAEGFVVSVRDRNYFFRLPKEGTRNGPDRNSERETWLKAFDKACVTKRRTVIMLDKDISLAGSQWSLDSLGDDLDRPSPPTSPVPSIDVFENIPEPDYFGSDRGSSPELTIRKMDMPPPSNLRCPRSPPPLPGRPPIGLKPILSTRVELADTNNDNGIKPHERDASVGKLQPRVFRKTVADSSKNNHSPTSPTSESLRYFPPVPYALPPPPPPPLSPPPSPPLAPPPPPLPPPPLAPPLPQTKNFKRSMKAIHWSRVPHHLLTDSIWENTRDYSSKLDFTLLEEEFAQAESNFESLAPQAPKKNKELLLDAKRAHNLEISLSGLRMNDTSQLEDALNSLQEDHALPADKLSILRRYQPTPDEVEMYKMYTDKREALHPVDQFMLDLCEIPYFGLRLDLVLTIWDFPKQFEYVSEMVSHMDSGCDEMLSSRELVMILEYLLAIGNYMNTGTTSSDTIGFQITSLDKISDVRGVTRGFTVLHYLVRQLRQIEPELLDWSTTVTNASKCSNCSIKATTAEIEVLQSNLTKIKKNLKVLQMKIKHCKKEETLFRKNAKKMTFDFEIKLDRLSWRCGQLQKKYLQVLDKYGEQTERSSDEFFGAVSRFVSKFKNAKAELESKG